jgi:hypothetical protein
MSKVVLKPSVRLPVTETRFVVMSALRRTVSFSSVA